jgi:hypothetical protein
MDRDLWTGLEFVEATVAALSSSAELSHHLFREFSHHLFRERRSRRGFWLF